MTTTDPRGTNDGAAVGPAAAAAATASRSTVSAAKTKALGTARTAYKNLRISLAGRTGTRLKVAVIYGNCQAEALLQVLKQRAAFTQQYQLVSIPPVQSLQPRDLHRVSALVARADLLLTQPVRDDYRGLPIGSEQMRALLPEHSTVLRFPSMFFAGLHPYHAYVHATGVLGTALPLTESYHDLRHLAAAGWGLGDDAALEWLHAFVGDAGVIRALAEEGVQALAEREKSLDVGISAALQTLAWNAFHTLNHPSNEILAHVATSVHGQVGLQSASGCPTPQYSGPQILGFLRAPVEADVAASLRLTVPPGYSGWTSHGQAITADEVALAHLAWYRQHPEVVAAGLAEHRERMRELGLAAPPR